MKSSNISSKIKNQNKISEGRNPIEKKDILVTNFYLKVLTSIFIHNKFYKKTKLYCDYKTWIVKR